LRALRAPPPFYLCLPEGEEKRLIREGDEETNEQGIVVYWWK